MNASDGSGPATDSNVQAALLETLIRAALIFALAFLCYSVFAPFVTLMLWALILAVAMYPMHQAIARRIGGRQGLAATLIVVIGALLIVLPTSVLLLELGGSIHELVDNVKNNTLQLPAPRPDVAEWPVVVGARLFRHRQHALGDDVPLNLVGAAGDRSRRHTDEDLRDQPVHRSVLAGSCGGYACLPPLHLRP